MAQMVQRKQQKTLQEQKEESDRILAALFSSDGSALPFPDCKSQNDNANVEKDI
jgi:hypothetical protein